MITVDSLLERYPTLCYAGMVPSSEQWTPEGLAYSRAELLLNGEAEIKACCEYLDGFAQLKRNNPLRTSYGLKHRVEYWMEHARSEPMYISNGSFIVAALLAGFDLSETPGRINVEFNISNKDVKCREREATERREHAYVN